jgi:hypothetical protein
LKLLVFAQSGNSFQDCIRIFSGNGKAVIAVKSLRQIPGGTGWIWLHNVSPDGRYLTYSLRTWEINVAMLENF